MQTLNLDSISESWHFVPGGSKRWVQGYEAIWLVDEAGKVMREIRRQADNHWLVQPDCMAVAADGSVAVVASNGMRRRDSANPFARLSIYDRDGKPIRTIELPGVLSAHSIAFDGTKAVISTGAQLVMANIATGALSVLEPEAMGGAPTQTKKDPHWQVQFGPGGELWAVDLNHRSANIERFEIPAARK